MNKRNLLFAIIYFIIMVKAVSAKGYIAPPMVNIPAGQFMMGAEGGDPATMPIHKVSVSAFQMGKYAVTVAEFRKFAEATGFNRESTCNDFIDANGLRGPGHIGSGRWDNHRYSYSEYQPVTCVSIEDANAYAKWLSKKTSVKYRIPTEQEWEYATKANTTSRYFWGDDFDLTKACLYGNFADHTGEHTNNQKYGLSNVGWIENVNCNDGEAYNAIVGLYRPNPFGLHDMVGNTSQYLNSCYSEAGYKLDSKQLDINGCEFLVHRGGTWHYPAQPHLTRGRIKQKGSNVSAGSGFRLAVDGHNDQIHSSTASFETKLKQAQNARLATRPKLLKASQSAYLTKIKGKSYRLFWQPSEDNRVTGYDIYQSKSRYAHLQGLFYQGHYDKVDSVGVEINSLQVRLPAEGGSFRVVAKSDKQTSLPSAPAVHLVEQSSVAIPGRIQAQDAVLLENIPFHYWEAKDDKPELYYLFKTNKNSDKSEATVTFKVDVKKAAWYQLNYRGNTFQKGEFFKLWQGNRMAGKFDFDPDIDDKTSKRHRIYLEQGRHQLQLSVHREKFDRWGLVWLEFTEFIQGSEE